MEWSGGGVWFGGVGWDGGGSGKVTHGNYLHIQGCGDNTKGTQGDIKCPREGQIINRIL